MDTSANPIVPQTPITGANDPVSQPGEPVGGQPSVAQTPPPAIQQPQYPISGPHKEFGPVMEAPVQEYIKPAEAAVEVHPEVKEAGVEAVPNHEQPQLQEEHKVVGIEPAKEAVPVQQAPTGAVTLPSLQQVEEEKKHLKTSDAKYWYDVELIKYIKRWMTGGKHDA